jgi:hypothetical protein
LDAIIVDQNSDLGSGIDPAFFPTLILLSYDKLFATIQGQVVMCVGSKIDRVIDGTPKVCMAIIGG